MWYHSSVSIKDCVVLASITSLKLCADRMLDFIGPDKSSSFCNYHVELYLPVSYGAFTFERRMKPRARTSYREQWPDFDLV
jgi:hypothetical protein